VVVTEHAATSTVEGPGGTAARAVSTAHESEHFSGRKISWIGVAIVSIGFVVGGAGFIPHMIWWLFWTGVGIVVVGGLILLSAKTFSEDWY